MELRGASGFELRKVVVIHVIRVGDGRVYVRTDPNKQDNDKAPVAQANIFFVTECMCGSMLAKMYVRTGGIHV